MPTISFMELKDIKDCVCIKDLIFQKEDRINSRWVEISFYENEIFEYRKVRIDHDTNIYKIYKTKEGIIIDTFSISENSFKEYFMEFPDFRNKRIEDILND